MPTDLEDLQAKERRLRAAGLAAEIVTKPDGPELKVTMPWSSRPYNVRTDEDLGLALSEAA